MRKLGLIAAGLITLPLVSTASADDGAKVTYKNGEGTRIETTDFDMKINLQIQPRFTYEDVDQEGRSDAGLESGEDSASFDLRRVRFVFSGNMLAKQWSYMVQSDLRSDSGGSDMKDAWLQWNNSDANIRAGQFKVPFSRQENVGGENLQFVDRSLVNDVFAPSRHMGAMVHGALADGGALHYYLGTFNGESTGEGRNRAGVDNKLAVYAALTTTSDTYGSRSYEGDQRADTSSLGYTAGASVIYGEGTSDVVDVGEGDFGRFDLNVDLGLRTGGLSSQTEFYYSTIDLKDVTSGEDTADLFGFYTQAGYMLDKQIELAGRFGFYQPDDNFVSVDDVQEYSLVLNYFINGHWLKVQNGITYEVTNFSDDAGGDDLTDFRYELQLAGYL